MEISILLAEQILAMFLTMAVGFGGVRAGLFKTEDSRIISNMVVYICNPCVVVHSFQIELTDEMAEQYDIYYRVHSQTYGWLGWAKNGESAGTEGQAKRLEAIEIQLVEKGGAAPGSTEQAFIKGE